MSSFSAVSKQIIALVLVPPSTPFVVTEPSVGPVHCTFPVVSCNLFAYFVLETLGAFQIKPHHAMRLKLQRFDAALEQICHYQGDPGAFPALAIGTEYCVKSTIRMNYAEFAL